MPDITYIDLFAGAGGLSEGFIRSGFKPLAHVEADKAAAFTLKTRLVYHYLSDKKKKHIYEKYLKGAVSREELYAEAPKELLDTVINEKIGDANQKIFTYIDRLIDGRTVDIIIGGPPCQAYSVVGRAPLKHRIDDERTKLYIHYGRFLTKYKPKAFLFENVPGILTAGNGEYFKNLQTYYKRIGYDVEARILNAQDYNVIQSRTRVIIMGWQKNLGWAYPEPEKTVLRYSRDDIFSDLPAISPGEHRRVQDYTAPPGKYLRKTALRNGHDFVSQHVSRPHNERDLQIYRLAIEYIADGERLKNNQIPQEMRTQQNTASFLDRFKVVDKLPHTVIAHISKDGHHFIHPDIKQLRSISVREAARIQSFPDDFFFEGVKENAFRSAAFRQIGNAVPPLMAECIASKIKAMIEN